MKKAVGFDQKILLNYLNYTANEANDTKKIEMYKKLEQYLIKDIKGNKSRKNAITILMKIWYSNNETNKCIQKRAFRLLPELDLKERIVLHWGRTLMAYPFFKEIASEIGRLSSRQHDFSSSQIYRKIKELYGDRRRVEVSCNAVFTSLKNWRVITQIKQGVYSLTDKIMIPNNNLMNWLVEAAIISSKREYIQIDEVLTLTYLFPFSFNINTGLLDNSIFEITNQDINKTIIRIKKNKTIFLENQV
jgi:hypothetical protein